MKRDYNVYSKVYNKKESYQDLAKEYNVEVPALVEKNVAYFNFYKNEIGYFGTARVGEKTRQVIKQFQRKLLEVIPL